MVRKKSISRIAIDLDEEDHKRLKTFAALKGKSMREIVSSWIKSQLKRSALKKIS